MRTVLGSVLRRTGTGIQKPSAWGWLVVLVGLIASTAPAQQSVDYSREIQPLLASNCYECHGPDANHRKGGFRLDVKESAFGVSARGHRVLVPGKPEESELHRRISSTDPNYRMPPKETGKTLSGEQVELIRRWIAEGATWTEHWAYVAPQRPPLPVVSRPDWCQSPVDTFILRRLDQEGLTPAPPAARETLVRRVALDLTGLPPTFEHVEEFVQDPRPDAYERLVDRLVNSPRFGEHMARYWLDAARYGDTHGLHLDNYREIWPYRDWVVRAFNSNLPYDQFIIEQLAGDLLPNPTLDQLIATGFLRCHVTTNEGGSIVEEVEVRNVVDRVVTFGTVFLGLTLECSRCHDHKYDPITQRDFYSLYAFFNSMDGPAMDGNIKDPPPVVKVATEEQDRQLKEYDRRIAELEQRLRGPWPELDEQQASWEKETLEKLRGETTGLSLGEWYWVGPFSSVRRYLVGRQQGPEGREVNLNEEFETPEGKVRWVRRPDWVDGKVHQDLPGNEAANFLYRALTSDRPRTVRVSLGSDDGIKVYLNNKLVFEADVQRGAAPDQNIVELNLQQGVNHLLIKIMNYGGASGFYFALKSLEAELPNEVVAALQKAPAERKPEEVERLRDHFRLKVTQHPEVVKLRTEWEGLRKARADLDRQIPTTLVFGETAQPKPAFILFRGEYDKPKDPVQRATPAFLFPMEPSLPKNRWGLAKWVVDPSHPLTARVAVNRFWQQVFGTGLVKTAEDFGIQGERPSHPELLDWLAVEFRDSGWDVKRLLRQLVTTAAYRQSAQSTPEKLAKDPANRLLSRGPRFRMDAEMLRDQALFVSGLLVEPLGGPPVKLPQPPGVWEAVAFVGSNTREFKADVGHEKVHRRSLYAFWKRTAPPPQMTALDAPSRESCIMRRERTNSPLQALVLMNEVQYVECCRSLAERAMREAGRTPEEWVAYMFRLATCRYPEKLELEELVEAYRKLWYHYQNQPEAVRQLLSYGETPPDTARVGPELAALIMVANVILNLDEVLNK
jgi:mono/diheme cytochrome c family protein/Mor family transcriptional regulator